MSVVKNYFFSFLEESINESKYAKQRVIREEERGERERERE